MRTPNIEALGATPDATRETRVLPSFVHTFTAKDCGGRWRGRTVRIFKRSERPFWYVQLVHAQDGKQHRTVLKTEAKTTAVQLAMEVCDKVWSGLPVGELPHPAPLPRERELATIAEILDVYERKGPLVQRGRRTVPDNTNGLRLVVREGLQRPTMSVAEVGGLRCDVFTETLARRFAEGRLLRVPAGVSDVRQSALVSIHSYLRAARSILQNDFRKWYMEDAGLVLADWSGFMGYAPEKPKRAVKRKPDRELVVKTFEAANLLRASDPQAYYAWLLGVYSLRRSEIQRCERSWLRREVLEDDADFLGAGHECWVIRTDRGKSDRERVIPVPDDVAQEIIAWWERDCAFREEFDRRFLIPAGRWYGALPHPSPLPQERGPEGRYVGAGEGSELRAHGVIIRINEWMRGLGWRTKKTLHEMRALFLRKVRAEHGLEAAQALGGHASARTTEQSYTGDRSLAGVVVEFPLLRRSA